MTMKTERNTRQKQIIYSALCEADHPTATELYEALTEREPKISRGTVFRVLGQFADSGKINRVGLPDGPARFDAKLYPHAHAHCAVCGRVFDVADDEISAVLNKQTVEGFTVYGARVEITGICKNCKQ